MGGGVVTSVVTDKNNDPVDCLNWGTERERTKDSQDDLPMMMIQIITCFTLMTNRRELF